MCITKCRNVIGRFASSNRPARRTCTASSRTEGSARDAQTESRVFVHVKVYTHIYVHACMHVRMYACMFAHVDVCMPTCMYACMHVCHLCMHACKGVCMKAWMCTCQLRARLLSTWNLPAPFESLFFCTCVIFGKRRRQKKAQVDRAV